MSYYFYKFLMLLAFVPCLFVSAAPQAIVFDLGGVVIESDPNKVAAFLSDKFEIKDEEAKALIKAYKTNFLKGMTPKEFWDKYAAEKEVDLNEEWLNEWQGVLFDSIRTIKGTLEVIEQLKAKGYVVGMLSNATGFQKEQIIKHGYYNLFNPVLISCEIGVEKPAQEAYEILLKELAIDAEACIFIDDKIENVEAAKKLGIQGIHFVDAVRLKVDLIKCGVEF